MNTPPDDTRASQLSDDDIPLSLHDVPFSLTRQKTDDTPNAQASNLSDSGNEEDDDVNDLDLPPLIARQITNAAPKGPELPFNKPPIITRQSTDDTTHDNNSRSPSAELPDLNTLVLNQITKQQTVIRDYDDTNEEAVDTIARLPHLNAIARQLTDAAAEQEAQSMDVDMAYLAPKVGTKAVSGMNDNRYLDETLLMFDDDGNLLEDEAFIGLHDEDVEHVATIEDDSINQFVEATDPIICMAFNPKKEHEICCGAQDDHCYIWNILEYDASARSDEKEQQKTYLKLNEHSDTVIDCAWNSSGKFIATASMDGSIKVYNCNKNMQLVSTLDIGEDVVYIKWHPNTQKEKKYRNILMAGALDRNVWIYEYNKTQKVFENTQVLSGHSGRITCGGFAKYKNGVCGYSGDDDGVIAIWGGINDGAFQAQKQYSFKPNVNNKSLYHESGINVMDDSALAPLLISGSCDRSVCLINYENGKILKKIGKHQDSVECVQFNKIHKHYASSSSLDGVIKIWDLHQGNIRSELKHTDGVIVHEWFNTESNSHLIACGTMDGMVRVWDSRNGDQIKQFKGHHQNCCIQTLQISNDDKYIVTGGDDYKAMVWQL